MVKLRRESTRSDDSEYGVVDIIYESDGINDGKSSFANEVQTMTSLVMSGNMTGAFEKMLNRDKYVDIPKDWVVV